MAEQQTQPGFQQYDPSSAAPYQAVQTPDPAPAMPSPLPTETPQIDGAVKQSGAIATIADGILRGWMGGRAYASERQTMQLKSKTDALQASYNQDAQRLYQLAAAGVDKNSPEYRTAQQAVQGSWGALMDFYGQHIDQDSSKKKSKLKQAGQNILGALHSQDPMEQSRAWYQVAQKAGPPVLAQVAMLDSPTAQQQRRTQGTVAQATDLQAQNALSREQAQQFYDKYAGLSQEDLDKLPVEEKQKFRNAQAVLFPAHGAEKLYQLADGRHGWFIPGEEPQGATAVQTGGAAKLYKSPDGKQQEWFSPGNEPEGWQAAGSGAGSKPVRAWTKGKDGKITSVLVDPNTNQMVPGSENPEIQPPSSMTGRISTGFYHWVDEDGKIHQTQETRTSMPAGGGGGSVTSSSPKPAATAPSAPGWIGSITAKPLYVVGGNPSNVPGMKLSGNINIMHRPNVSNPDGTYSSVRSISIGTDRGEVLIPTVSDGSDGKPPHVMTDAEATAEYKRTGKNLGTFDTPAHATAYAQKLHQQQSSLGQLSRRGNSPTAQPPAAQASSPAPSGAPKDQILGNHGTPEEISARKLADIAEAAYEEAKERAKNPTPIGDTGIVLNWVKSQIAGAGRMNNVEIENALKSGSYGTRMSNAYNRAVNGTLDNKFRKQMVDDIGRYARVARRQADTYKTEQASTEADQLPDTARKQLKHGHITTFANGQQWTLDENGEAKRVDNGAN